jgi:hypothetical protein
MTVDRFTDEDYRREQFVEAVADEHRREECPATCGYYGPMDVELTCWGAYVCCPQCGAGYDVEPCEAPLDPRGV